MNPDDRAAPRHLPDLSDAELGAWLAAAGEPAYRAEQIFDWVFRRRAVAAAQMTDLPAGAARGGWPPSSSSARGARWRARRRRTVPPSCCSPGRDGATTECVMIPGASGRRTACLSTQVGCDVGCTFCASGIGGALRDLTAGEVLEQALAIGDLLSAAGERLSHVVFMGMGEPLANYDVTVAAARRLNAARGLGIAQRRITLSTVGLPKQIERLAGEGLQITLAVSLHAPNDRAAPRADPLGPGYPVRPAARGLPPLLRAHRPRGHASNTVCWTGSTIGRSTPPSWPPSPATCGRTSIC